MFCLNQRIERVLPGPRADAGITARQVRLGELQVNGGLLRGLVFGEDDLFRRIAVLRLQTGAFARHAIDTVECCAAFATVDQTETIFHRLSCASLPEKQSELLRCYGRVG